MASWSRRGQSHPEDFYLIVKYVDPSKKGKARNKSERFPLFARASLRRYVVYLRGMGMQEVEVWNPFTARIVPTGFRFGKERKPYYPYEMGVDDEMRDARRRRRR